MKCEKCYHLDLFYDMEGMKRGRCLKNNLISESGCNEFMEIDEL